MVRVDVRRFGWVRVGVLGYCEGDGCEGDGFAEEPGYALLRGERSRSFSMGERLGKGGRKGFWGEEGEVPEREWHQYRRRESCSVIWALC